MNRVRYHPAAAEEAEEAAAWYAGERLQLGEDFAKELSTAIAQLRQEPISCVRHPYAAPRLKAKRVLLHRFPYDVVVVERDETVLIVAVAHHSRRPGYWKHRLRT